MLEARLYFRHEIEDCERIFKEYADSLRKWNAAKMDYRKTSDILRKRKKKDCEIKMIFDLLEEQEAEAAKEDPELEEAFKAVRLILFRDVQTAPVRPCLHTDYP